ncbi:hypothetical protein SAMN04490209_3308 [Pseudomonas rhodesiae]|uniref:Uncharacterized protein n=1 Tax=Pseudomonas rhodesiae TaxID=76760 RepID=A0AAE8HE18_9PSED|nr:hypothetical protein SAMN04490209_3308 [Pseudomonas rhodesiae]
MYAGTMYLSSYHKPLFEATLPWVCTPEIPRKSLNPHLKKWDLWIATLFISFRYHENETWSPRLQH